MASATSSIVSGDDQLVRRLDRLAGAGWPDQHDRLAHGLEHRLHLVEVSRFGTDHDRQLWPPWRRLRRR